MILAEKTAVLGTGLLGASFARAVKEKSVSRAVSGWSRSASTRGKCRALADVFDFVCETPEDACRDADLVVVCAPTLNIPELVERAAKTAKKGAVITDVGSVKKSICEECAKRVADTGTIFVGSHPMAGSEKIGIDFSEASLFEGRPCFIASDGKSSGSAASLLEKVWTAIGMDTYFVRPEVHDAIVARVSHLPHMLSGLMCNNAAKFENGDLRKYSGPGFRDFTRISSGSPEMWDSIVRDNRAEILRALKLYRSDLTALIEAFENSDFSTVGNMLRSAKAYRDKL